MAAMDPGADAPRGRTPRPPPIKVLSKVEEEEGPQDRHRDYRQEDVGVHPPRAEEWGEIRPN